MTLTLDRWECHPLHLRYHRPMRWASMEESGADFLLLVLHTAEGQRGVAEAAVRLAWTGFTMGALVTVLDDVVLSRLKGLDIANKEATDRALSRIPEHSLAKSVADAACWDLRAQDAGVPLWKLLKGSQTVPVSWILTRQAPEIMAEEAARITSEYGIGTLKLKTGQGLETDQSMLNMVRDAVGDSVMLYADANSYCTADTIVEYTALLRDVGCVISEDPCTIMPDAPGRLIREASDVPIMIDKWCRNYFQARVFLDWGADAVSVKYSKSGMSDSLRILAYADAANAQAPIGLSGNSALGSLASLSLAATRPQGGAALPTEESFFLQLAEDYITEPLSISAGVISLPDSAGAADLVDWDKVDHFRV
jgi:L-alanine-DL-glutamate epimerase-like enolase superfamily enzyme